MWILRIRIHNTVFKYEILWTSQVASSLYPAQIQNRSTKKVPESGSILLGTCERLMQVRMRKLSVLVIFPAVWLYGIMQNSLDKKIKG